MNGHPRRSRRISALAAMVLATTGQAAEKWAITGWNNLGMHCMDSDYSVFSILPPSNTLHAQVIYSIGTTSADMVTTLMTGADGFRVTYEAVADPAARSTRLRSGKPISGPMRRPCMASTLPGQRPVRRVDARCGEHAPGILLGCHERLLHR